MAVHQEEPTGWVGWVAFGGYMMVIIGIFQAIAGLVALFKDEYFLVPKADLVVSVNYTAWGWVHLGIGALLVLAGVSLFSGNMYGRVIGVIAASLSAIVNVAFLAAYPIWSTIVIALDVIVIYAIVVHGRELQE